MVSRAKNVRLIVDSNNFMWIRGLKLIFSAEFDHSEPSVTKFVVKVFHYDISSRSKYVPYTLSVIMMQNSCCKGIFILPGDENCCLLPYFGQV